jgi:hypothetical protein
MYKGALSTNRLLDLRVAEEARKRRKESSSKVVQKYGEIYGNQARKQIEADIQDELKVVNMRDKRLSKPWRIKYKKIMVDLVQDYWMIRYWMLIKALRR